MNTETIVSSYLNGLTKQLPEEDSEALSYAFGATDLQIASLLKKYPDCSDTLIQFLRRINGTFYQQYGDHKISVLILGSDVEDLAYYLRSAEQMLEEDYDLTIRERYGASLTRDAAMAGPGINVDVSLNKWLCFSVCMNNGGTSSLYIDFDPGPGGKVGQVVRFLHDPDSFRVIADSFSEYLQLLQDNGYKFIDQDDEEEHKQA